MEESSPTLSILLEDKDFTPPLMQLEKASLLPHLSGNSDDDDFPQMVQPEENSASVGSELTSEFQYRFLQPLPGSIEWLDASLNRPHRHKQILCNIVMCDAVLILFKLVSINFKK